MRRFSLLLLLAGLIASCSDSDQSLQPKPASDPASRYAVSVETALANLQSTMGAIAADQGQTRAGLSARSVASIRPLSMASLRAKTRATATVDVENLLYVVSFEDGKGSAVLGADTRVVPVYAILDETVLTPEDFVRPAVPNDGEEEDIRTFLTNAILSDALNGIEQPQTNGSGIEIGGGDWGDPVHKPTYRKAIVNQKAQSPLLQTKWHQDAPYNNDCDWNDDHTARCPAGCANIAIGQLLLFHQTGSTITIDGKSFSWSLLNECKYGSYPSAAAKNEVARYIHAIGIKSETEYKEDKGTTHTPKVPGVLNQLGCKGASLVTSTEAAARGMIYTKKYPFIITAPGHGWIIDGWNEYTEQDWMRTYGPGGKINPEVLIGEMDYCYAHCNFGWAGKCDGYYIYNVFNTTKMLDSSKIDQSIGDIPFVGDPDGNFTTNIRIITYNR